MSKVLHPNYDDLELDEDLVRAYLEQNPDFFVQHADLVTQLRIPHASHGAVSLLEKRQEIQRAKIIKMEEELSMLLVIENCFTKMKNAQILKMLK